MKKKRCSKCKKIKLITKFYQHRGCVDVFVGVCKKCASEKSKKDRDPIKNRNKVKNWRMANQERYKKYHIQWYMDNKSTQKEKAHKWYISNQKVVKTKIKQYRTENINKIRSYQNKYQKRRYNSDIQHNITCKLRSRVRAAIKRQYTEKAFKSTELLGCSFQEFKIYFKSKFTKGMTWKRFMNGEIHIDHIRPCINFNLIDLEQQKECFNYKNLQPLWAFDNNSKGVKFVP